MNRAKMLSIGILLVLALLIGYLAWSNRQPPVLPADENHAVFVNAEGCLGDCHGPDGGYPKGENHPLGNDCWRCHGRP